MQTYSQFAPTGFDRKGAFLDDDRQSWIVVPVSQTRDSGPLDQSNFASALAMLGGESDDVEVHRFGHWGPGWFEVIIVNPANAALVKIAESIESSLADYPVLDDQDHSRREWDCYLESWDSWGRRDYTKLLAKRLLADFSNGVSEDWTDDEICDAISELTTEEIDSLRAGAAQKVNWEYQADGDGVTINISGLVDKTDTDKLADLCIEYLEATQRAKDIAKLADYLGAPAPVKSEAISRGFNLVSQIKEAIETFQFACRDVVTVQV